MAGGARRPLLRCGFARRILPKVLAVSRAMSLAILPSFNEDAAKLGHERTVQRSPMFRERKGLKRMQRTAGKRSQVSLTQVQNQAFVLPSDALALVLLVSTAAFVFQALAVNSLA